LKQVERRLRQWGVKPSDELMKQAFAKWDSDKSGRLEFDEFYEVVMPGNCKCDLYTQSAPKISLAHIICVHSFRP
jgi:Ca2+-binding EF-hand superfamily protein